MAVSVIDVVEHEPSFQRLLSRSGDLAGAIETLGGQSVGYETSLERDFVYLLDFNARVDSIQSRPISIRYQSGNQGLQTYTPGYLVRFVAIGNSKPWRPTLYEVTYEGQLIDQGNQLAPGFTAARKYCKLMGWNFRIVTEPYIRNESYLANVMFLRNYRTYPDDGAKCLMLLQTMEALKVATPWQLLAATFMDITNRMEAVGVLWRLIAARAIGANLMNKLTMVSEIWHEEPALHGDER